jgi:DNA polymerase I-like protein with 3'-5' exonuclease and polymerase domains
VTSILAVDVETEGLHHTAGLTSISFTNEHRSVVFGVNHPEQKHTEGDALKKIQRIVDNSDVLIAQKAHFEIKHLLNAGIKLNDKMFICTKILAYLASGQIDINISLNDLALRSLNKEKIKGLDFKKKKASEYPLKELLHYNKRDTELTYGCYKELISKVPKDFLQFYSDLSYMYADIEMNGCHIDQDKFKEFESTVTPLLEKYSNMLIDALEYPINPNSGPQLSCALFGGTFQVEKKRRVLKKFKTVSDKYVDEKYKEDITLKGLGFGTSKLTKTKDGYWPTNKNVLAGLKGRSKKAKEWIALFKEYRKVKHLYSTFITGFNSVMIDSFIHPNLHLTSTVTGRPSCTKPNLFNIPRDNKGTIINIKEAFTSRFGSEGRILDVDFSSAEWRIAAILCGCEKMIQRIKDGVDAHKYMASRPEVFNVPYDEVTKDQRQDAKAMNFGIIYGQNGWGFAHNRDDIPSITTEAQGTAFVNTAYAEMPGLKVWHEKILAIAGGKGELIMPTGRWYNFKGDLYDPRNIKNYPVQGLSSDMVFCCLLEVWKIIRNRRDVFIINSVYDCVVLDCKNEAVTMEIYKIIMNVFTNAAKYVKVYFPDVDLSAVPIEAEAEYGTNWGNMEKINE